MFHEQQARPTMLCPKCGRPMRLAHVVPGIGALPELLTFECRACAEVITEAKEHATNSAAA